jgi:hypothetical protein
MALRKYTYLNIWSWPLKLKFQAGGLAQVYTYIASVKPWVQNSSTTKTPLTFQLHHQGVRDTGTKWSWHRLSWRALHSRYWELVLGPTSLLTHLGNLRQWRNDFVRKYPLAVLLMRARSRKLSPLSEVQREWDATSIFRTCLVLLEVSWLHGLVLEVHLRKLTRLMLGRTSEWWHLRSSSTSTNDYDHE